MDYVTHILVNADRSRTYVGQTENIEQRLLLHNANRVRSTRSKGPWQVLHCEQCDSRAEAMRREMWFKSKAGRRRIKQIITERWPSG